MTPGARVAAAIGVLDQINEGVPAQKALLIWARSSRFAGSRDRAAVRDHVFDALRRLRSAQWQGGGDSGRHIMAGLLRLQGVDPDTLFTGQGHAPAPLTDTEQPCPDPMPDAVRADLPDWIFPMLRKDLGDDLGGFIEHSQHRAPIFLRVAKAAMPRAATLLEAEGITTRPVSGLGNALEVTGNPRRVQSSGPYRDGLVELQDAGAQALCAALPLHDGDRVLDYCAGGGGKVLALADRARIKGFAYDAAPQRMADLPKRARRAGQRVTITDHPETHAPYDLVLCDVPCSGSGTWRRNPDAKWRLTADALSALTKTQYDILTKAAPLVAPHGTLAYATCSVLNVENKDIIQRFLQSFDGQWQVQDMNTWLPGPQGDGFFASVLKKC